MRKTLFILSFIVLYTVQIRAQQKPISRQIAAIGSDQFSNVTLFSSKATTSSRAVALNKYVSNFNLLEVDPIALKRIAANEISRLEIDLPLDGGNTVTLQLVKSKVVDGQTVFSTQNGSVKQNISHNAGAYYQGVVKNQPNTIAAISFFNNSIIGVIANENGNYVLGKSNTSASESAEYIVYNEKDLRVKDIIICETKDDHVNLPVIPNAPVAAGNCVRVYVEADYQVYLDNGSNVTNAINYVLGIFNVTTTLYQNESINTTLSQVKVWTSADPYISGTNTSTALALFQTQMSSGFNGNLAHLFSARALGGGLAAGFGVLCGSNSQKTAVSGNLNSGVTPSFPTYSWNAMVVTHEMGHCLGSRHTHACVWNGNNTAIDGCSGFTEGGCPLPGIPAAGGTLMSYCHIKPVGINFSLGFGIQPGNVIRNHVNSAACLTPCCPGNITITGNYNTPLTESSTWIKSLNQTTILNTANVKLDANPANGYVELKPVNASDFFLAAPTTTNATFVAQALDGCGGGIPFLTASTETVTVKNDAIKKLTLYPNPSDGIVNLDIIFDATKSAKIAIYNVLGQEVYARDLGQLAEVHLPINLGDQKEGLYLIRIHADSYTETRQVVLTK